MFDPENGGKSLKWARNSSRTGRFHSLIEILLAVEHDFVTNKVVDRWPIRRGKIGTRKVAHDGPNAGSLACVGGWLST